MKNAVRHLELPSNFNDHSVNYCGLPRWHSGSPANIGDARGGVGSLDQKAPCSRNGNPTPGFYPGKSYGQGSWWLSSMESQRVQHDW